MRWGSQPGGEAALAAAQRLLPRSPILYFPFSEINVALGERFLNVAKGNQPQAGQGRSLPRCRSRYSSPGPAAQPLPGGRKPRSPPPGALSPAAGGAARYGPAWPLQGPVRGPQGAGAAPGLYRRPAIPGCVTRWSLAPGMRAGLAFGEPLPGGGPPAPLLPHFYKEIRGGKKRVQ